MSITHVTAHYLKRESDTPAQLSLRQALLAIDEHKGELLDQLKNSFLGRLNRQHGRFKSEEGRAESERSVLSVALDSFLSDEQDFTEVTTAMMKSIEQAINGTGFEMNAHFLFFIEKSSEYHHVFYLFVVHQNESLAISEQLEVTPSYAIDTGPSLAGIKVDIAEWKKHQNYAYLTLLCPRGKLGLPETLESLSGFSDGVDKEDDTKRFLEGVDAFAKQLPVEQVKEYREQVVNYCMAQDEKDEPVSIEKLSHELEGVDRDQFIQEISAHHPSQDRELMVDRRSLKRYVKFSGREKDLSITFSTSHLHSRVHYDMESDTLTVRGLPKALRMQLLAHME